ncbi:MAG: PepSY domain-containing protein, partial [Candidatus Wildermuthbacteria bacterium]|nr:PepSY domain-containing protein [Candidatus Wildermuthbacteria bacterium]
FALGAHAKLELMGEIIRIIPDGQSEAGISVSAQAAANIIEEGNHLDKIFSVTLIRVDGKKIWEVSGMKDLGLSNAFVDASTGAVIATE